ncbi:MAG: spore cortex-lytic enzyme [Candidatus Caccovivens sp.]
MKKKLIAITFAVVFAILSMGTVAVVTTNVITSNVQVVDAALTTSQIRTVQTKLKRWGYYTGTIDGIYGNLTRKAVRLFQSKNGLTVDGVVGPKTAAALGMTLTTDNSSTSNSDLYLLAKCVYAEARGESYVGQVAVAAVILNRVKSADFPNTIAGVIYQPWAFTAVNDGQINLEPNQTAYNAARDALNGWDPTYGALYYYNASTATNKWIYNKKTTVTIGNHVFAV